MPSKTILLSGVVDRLFANPELFVRSRLVGCSGWQFVPEPVQERFLGLLVARFAVLPFGSPLAAYGLGVLDAFESCELPAVVSRSGRDAMIERVERGVLAEMIRAGVITYPISRQVAA